MPNFFSAFTSEVFRPIATLLIPGAIGISPWFIFLLWRHPALLRLASANHTETGFLVLLAMIFAGLVFEDAGSHLESWLDNRANATNGVHIAQWYEYLRTAFCADPIGRRYIRTLVLKLKFEVGVAFSMVSAGLGVLWLSLFGLDCRTVLSTTSVCSLFLAWGLYEACKTHEALAKARSELLKEIRIIGGRSDATPFQVARPQVEQVEEEAIEPS